MKEINSLYFLEKIFTDLLHKFGSRKSIIHNSQEVKGKNLYKGCTFQHPLQNFGDFA